MSPTAVATRDHLVVIESESGSVMGTSHKQNQDSRLVTVLVNTDLEHTGAAGVLLAVADGATALPGGELASSAAIRSLERFARSSGGHFRPNIRPHEVEVLLERAIAEANDNVNKECESNGLESAATTLTMAVLLGDRVWVAAVGDSPAMMWDGRSVERVINGRPPGHVEGSFLGRQGGRPCRPLPEIRHRSFAPGHTVLLGTDGLERVLDEDTLRHVMSLGDASKGIEQLMRIAREKEARDDATAVMARIQDVQPLPQSYAFQTGGHYMNVPHLGRDIPSPRPTGGRPRRVGRRGWELILMVGLLVVATVVLWMLAQKPRGPSAPTPTSNGGGDVLAERSGETIAIDDRGQTWVVAGQNQRALPESLRPLGGVRWLLMFRPGTGAAQTIEYQELDQRFQSRDRLRLYDVSVFEDTRILMVREVEP